MKYFQLLVFLIVQLLILEISCAEKLVVVKTAPGPIINTQYGPVQGLEEFYKDTKSVYTYKGIRYAAPPIGNLRFRQPQSPTPWTHVFQATKHGSWCPQIDMNTLQYAGSEDCLFLNIATPKSKGSNFPVVVNFHGGGLHSGAGDIEPLRADYVNENGVIYVAPNYRLNILGFFNSGDRHAPGNFGIKDMIMALTWVRNNIANFGGDPNNVSIMGVSGGAVAVSKLNTFYYETFNGLIFRFTPWLCREQQQVSSIKLFLILAQCSIPGLFQKIQLHP